MKTVQKQLSGLNNTVSRTTSAITNQFKKMSNSINNSFKGIAKLAGIGVGLAALTKLGKSAIQAASDLEEIQNVVNVVFGDSAGQVDAWAKSALSNFGLIESEAKDIASTFKAMANGMGIVDKDGKNMSLTLAGLAGDLASFRNTTADVAATALGGVFTGETEALKKFGVVMTEANLSAFALSQGITKSYNAMSQAEKVALRYQYVMSTTADAQGDFVRSANSWANQVKVLKGQWTQFLGVLGTALKQVLAPLLQVLNQLLASMITFAKTAFSLMGIDFSVTAASVSTAAASVGDLNDNLGETASTAKKVKKALAGFDELNILSFSDTGGSGSGTGTGGGGGSGDLNITEPEIKMDKTEASTIGSLDDMLKSLNDWFLTKMNPWLDEKSKWLANKINDIVDNTPWDLLGITAANGLNGIITALDNLFATINGYNIGAGLATLINNFIDTFDAYKFGQMIGDKIKLGLDTAIGFLKTLDATALGTAIANWFNGIKIEEIAGKVGAVFSGAISAGLDVAIAFLQGTDGEDLKTAWDNFWDNIDFEGIKEKFKTLFTEIGNQIDECFGEGSVTKIKTFVTTVGLVTLAFEALQLAVKAFDAGLIFQTLYVEGSGLIGLFKNLSLSWASFIGGLNLPSGLTDLLVSPFLSLKNVLLNGVGPAISGVITNIGNVFAHPLASIKAFVSGASGAFSSLRGAVSSFVTGIPGMLSGALSSLGTFFTGLGSTIATTVSNIVAYVSANGILGTAMNGLKAVVAALQGGIQALFAVMAAHPFVTVIAAIALVVAAVKNLWDNCENFRKFITELWENTIKPIVDRVWEAVQELVQDHLLPLWEQDLKPCITAIGDVVKNVWNAISHIIGIVIEVISPVVTAVIGILGGLLKSVTEILGGVIDVIRGILTFITGVFTGDWKKAWEGVKLIFKGVWEALVGVVKAPINAIIGLINGLIGGIVAGINVAIRAINKLSITIPDWVPGIGGKKFGGFNIAQMTAPSIPYLAKGGVITDPTMAMVGEYPGANRNPEIVTPQNLLQNIITEGNSELVNAMYSMCKQMIAAIEGIDMEVSIGDDVIAASAKRGNDDYKRRTGKPMFA